MKTEKKIEVLVVKSFSGTISPIEKDILETWLGESPDNVRIYNNLKNIWQVAYPAYSPDTINVVEAERKFMELVKVKRLIHSKVIVWWQRAAAILIIPLISLAAYLLYNQNNIFISKNEAFQEITSPLGLTSKIDLPDGSTVWLNSGSKLKYPVPFDRNVRNVHLQGEAYFKVQSNKLKPFIVSTEKLSVKATGTQFNVEAYTNDSLVAVTLIEGKVDVNIDKSANENLQPNQRIVLNSISKKYNISMTDARHWGVWKDGIQEFRNESLAEVFRRIGRTYNVDIVVKDPVVAKQLYRATFKDESLNEILRLLKLTSNIRYKRIERVLQPNNKYNKEQIEVYSYKQ